MMGDGLGWGTVGTSLCLGTPSSLQLLWDLELLTGAGLGLFWPPWAQSCRLRGQAQHTQSQPRSRSGREEKQLVSRGTA